MLRLRVSWPSKGGPYAVWSKSRLMVWRREKVRNTIFRAHSSLKKTMNVHCLQSSHTQAELRPRASMKYSPGVHVLKINGTNTPWVACALPLPLLAACGLPKAHWQVCSWGAKGEGTGGERRRGKESAHTISATSLPRGPSPSPWMYSRGYSPMTEAAWREAPASLGKRGLEGAPEGLVSPHPHSAFSCGQSPWGVPLARLVAHWEQDHWFRPHSLGLGSEERHGDRAPVLQRWGVCRKGLGLGPARCPWGMVTSILQKLVPSWLSADLVSIPDQASLSACARQLWWSLADSHKTSFLCL